jgi:hypothetical protein
LWLKFKVRSKNRTLHQNLEGLITVFYIGVPDPNLFEIKAL